MSSCSEESTQDEDTTIDESLTTTSSKHRRDFPSKNMQGMHLVDNSTHAVYEEIEVEHQSYKNSSQESWRNNGSFHIHVGGGRDSGSGKSSPARSTPGRGWNGNQAGRDQFHAFQSTPENNPSTRRKVRSAGRSANSSSQESPSSWFPVPSLLKSQGSRGNRVSSPLNSLNLPFDERASQRDRSSQLHSRGAVKKNGQFSNDNAKSPARNKYQNVPSNASPNTYRRERPWRTDNPTKNTSQFKDSQSNYYDNRPRSTPYPKVNPGSNRYDSPRGRESPPRYRNPFSSVDSDTTYINRFESSFQSMNPHYDNIPYFNSNQNPFDSMSTTSFQRHQHSNNRSRLSSKSPERQRIIKPAPSAMNKESQLHSLLSCATNPSDKKWMEALQLLANSPNPTQLAQMKITHAHNWTALHIAALSNPPLYLIYGLLLAYPGAVKEMDDGGRLPIHLASGSEASVSILSILVRFYDYSVVVEDGRGLTPLHLALLRDGEEDMSTDVIRVLLGQNENLKRKADFGRKVKDGCMRRGDHLNLKLSEVKTGMFGENPNTIFMKERQKRETRMKNLTSPNKTSYSRGFARDILEVDSADGIPYKHEYLASLWEEEGVMNVDIFGDAELIEAQNFGLEAQQCLKKLVKWKKSQEEKNEDKSQSNRDSERRISPSSIPAPNMRLPIHMAIKRNYKVAKTFRLSTKKQNDILRILIHDNPSSLMQQDIHGKSPIMTCLELACNDPDYQVDLEMVELLLGIGTSGFRIAPDWLEDIDFVGSQQKLINERNGSHFNDYTTYNPAMVPHGQTLPLHVVVSQSLSPPIVQTIYFCYPGAKYIQDERKCTPLHCALQHSSNDDNLDMSMFCLLVDEKVATMRDISNNSVLDLLIESCKKGGVPSYSIADTLSKRTFDDFPSKDIKSQLQVLFQYSFLEVITSSEISSKIDKNLEGLRYLPSWMRDIAFGIPAVQKKLISKVSFPMSTALIMVNAIILFMLVIFFMDSLEIMLNQGQSIPQAYVSIVILSFIYLALNGVCHSFMAFHQQIGWSSCILNFWSWITLFGLIVPFVTFLHFVNYKADSDGIINKNIFLLSTISVGLLWAMVIGFISRWCYGVSLFCLSIIKIIRNLVPSFAVLTVCLVSITQMIYVTQRKSLGSDERCMELDDEGISEVCTIWGSIKISYHLASGGELQHSRNTDNQGLEVLYLLLVIVFFVIVLHSVATSIVNIKAFLSTNSMVEFYWAPIFTHILLVEDISNIFPCRNRDQQSEESKYSFGQRRLEITWDYICASFESTNSKNTRWGQFQRDIGHSHLLTNTLFVRLVGIVLIPIWLVVGLFTFGILWPPQCRRWLFSWSFSDEYDTSHGNEEKHTGSPRILREDISRMKGMLYERFHDMQSELHDIKRVIS